MDEVGAGPNVRIRLGVSKEPLKVRDHILLFFINLSGSPSLYGCIAPQVLEDALNDLAFRHFVSYFPSIKGSLGVPLRTNA
jgi:hypothetical protein